MKIKEGSLCVVLVLCIFNIQVPKGVVGERHVKEISGSNSCHAESACGTLEYCQYQEDESGSWSHGTCRPKVHNKELCDPNMNMCKEGTMCQLHLHSLQSTDQTPSATYPVYRCQLTPGQTSINTGAVTGSKTHGKGEERAANMTADPSTFRPYHVSEGKEEKHSHWGTFDNDFDGSAPNMRGNDSLIDLINATDARCNVLVIIQAVIVEFTDFIIERVNNGMHQTVPHPENHDESHFERDNSEFPNGPNETDFDPMSDPYSAGREDGFGEDDGQADAGRESMEKDEEYQHENPFTQEKDKLNIPDMGDMDHGANQGSDRMKHLADILSEHDDGQEMSNGHEQDTSLHGSNNDHEKFNQLERELLAILKSGKFQRP